MAEGGHPPGRTTIHKYYINIPIGASEETSTTTTVVRGDQVGTKNEVRAGEIGTVTMSPGPNENVEEQEIVEGVEEMNLSKSGGAVSKLKKLFDGKDRPQRGDAKPEVTARTSNVKSTDLKSHTSKEQRRLRKAFLRERCNALFGQSEYSRASSALEELDSLQETTSLDVALQMAECYLYLGREKKAEKVLQTVRDILMTSQLFTANEVNNLGSELVKSSSYIRAIILLRIASDMYETTASSPDDVINNIYSCISKTDDAVIPMIEAGDRARILAVDYGIEYMGQMFQKIKIVKNANPDNKALKEATSMNWIQYNLAIAGKYEQSLEICQIGVKLLEQQFGSNSSKYCIYGNLLHNIGVNLHNINKYSEAEGYYARSVEAKEKATDWNNESKKQEDIELSKNGLKATRAELGKN